MVTFGSSCVRPPSHRGHRLSDTDDDEFDDALYFASNPDLKLAFDDGVIGSARDHWRDAGRAETLGGGRPSLSDAVLADAGLEAGSSARMAPGLDVASYLEMNVDLPTVLGGDIEAARRHWVEHGSLEGRFGAGDAPFRERRPDVGAVLARPFGVDLYLDVEGNRPDAVGGRRLLRAIRRAGLAVSIRPFVTRDDIPRVQAGEAGRPASTRVSLIAASPATLRRLHRLYPNGHFDATYVIGFWPSAAVTPHFADYQTFGAVDEVWVPSSDLYERLASVAPVPVRLLALPGARLPAREAARERLGMPLDAQAIMLVADLVADGNGGLRLPAHMADLAGRLKGVPKPGQTPLLVVRVDARSIEAAEAATRSFDNAIVVTDQRVDGASLVLAACDALIASPGLEADIADAHRAGLAVIAPTRMALAAYLESGAGLAPVGLGPRALDIRGILEALGLDAPMPKFVGHIGRSRNASLPVPVRRAGEPLSPALPVVSILVDARVSSAGSIGRVAAALASAAYPFWELCVSGASATTRDSLEADPRIRLHPGSPQATRAAVLNGAARVATGSHFILARSMSEAVAAASSFVAIVRQIRAHPDADVLLAGDPPGCSVMADRIDAGGIRPVVIRASAFHGAGGLRALFDPAAEYDLLLRVRGAGGAVACVLSGLAGRDAEPHDAAEAGRLALNAHLRETVGPLAFADSGLVAATYRRRTYVGGSIHPTMRLGRACLADQAEASGDYLVMIDEGIDEPGPESLDALLEFLCEQEIGAVGGLILHADTTVHHAGLRLGADGGLIAPGRGLPNDPTGPVPSPFIVHNPDAVGGVLAVRRSVLLQAGGFEPALRASEGVTFDLLAADLCLRLGHAFGLRTTYTPFAVFTRRSTEVDGTPTAADLLFRRRWAR